MSGLGADWSRGCGRGCEYVCLLHVPFSSALAKVAMRRTAKGELDAVIMATPHSCVKICAGSARTRCDVCAVWTRSGDGTSCRLRAHDAVGVFA